MTEGRIHGGAVASNLVIKHSFQSVSIVAYPGETSYEDDVQPSFVTTNQNTYVRGSLS